MNWVIFVLGVIVTGITLAAVILVGSTKMQVS